jgi:hypothetical protein
MTRECSFILSTGKKCRAPATRNQTLCHHHAPKPAVPGPPPIPKSQRYSHLARWRDLRRNLQWLPLDEIPATIHDILSCLIDRGPGQNTGEISDLIAGQYLRALLNRLGDVPFPYPEFAQPAPEPVVARPKPDQKLDRQTADALIDNFAKTGLIPPEFLPPAMRTSRS